MQLEQRIFSGIPGLDERIGNGFIKGSTTAIIGTSGTAKSTFAFQYIAEGVRKGEPGVFYSLGENIDEIRIMAKGYGYNIAELVLRMTVQTHLFQVWQLKLKEQMQNVLS